MNETSKKIGVFLSDLVIIIGVCLLLTQFVFFKGTVVGASMEHTLHNGQQLIIDKISYRVSDPKRFDIVVVHFPGEESDWVKRVIGLPGEKVEYNNGELSINGKIIDEDFLSPGVITRAFSTDEVLAGTNKVIPDGEYLVLGDNRNNSKDGRVMGTIKKDGILGVARIRVFPFTEISIL
ncbi:MAG: signal peptidase I [Culicoidibacterales bacterium]